MKTKSKISLPALIKKCQVIVNAYIRLRDKDKPCVSCGSPNTEHASHFYSASKHSALRFNELNIHLSCLHCNFFLSGNLLPYRTELLKRIGEDNLLLLEATATRSRVHKWGRGELEIIIKEYSEKIKQLS